MHQRFMVLSFALAAASAEAQRQAVILESANDALSGLTDTVSLQQAGFVVFGFRSGVRDLTPFQGQHWIHLPRFMTGGDEIRNPTFLMYLPISDSMRPVGVAYTRRLRTEMPLPGMLGFEKAEWHSHVFCRNVPGEGAALADGPDDCTARGGQPAPNQVAMVHAWTIPNPDGPWAHDNPALPYIAAGLKPPQHHATREDRLVGIALGETYGAKLPNGHRIELEARRTGRDLTVLESPRAKLRKLADELRAAEKAGDGKRQSAVRQSLIAAYAELVVVYKKLALTPEIGARLEVELKQASGEVAHRHM